MQTLKHSHFIELLLKQHLYLFLKYLKRIIKQIHYFSLQKIQVLFLFRQILKNNLRKVHCTLEQPKQYFFKFLHLNKTIVILSFPLQVKIKQNYYQVFIQEVIFVMKQIFNLFQSCSFSYQFYVAKFKINSFLKT